MADDSLPPLNQNTYVKESALALWEHLPRVILYGFLFSLFCLPSLTFGLVFDLPLPATILAILIVGPAWSALNEAVSRTVLRDPYSIWRFFIAFFHYYLRSLLLAGLMAMPVISLARDLPLLGETTVAALTWVRLGTAVAGGIFLLALYVYAYPIMVLYDVGFRLALKNSFVLAVKYASNTLGLLAMAGLLGWLAFRVSPFLWIVLPAGWLVFTINNCRMVLSFELGDNEKEQKDPP